MCTVLNDWKDQAQRLKAGMGRKVMEMGCDKVQIQLRRLETIEKPPKTSEKLAEELALRGVSASEAESWTLKKVETVQLTIGRAAKEMCARAKKAGRTGLGP